MKAPIKTLDDLLARCDEVGDCWEWKLRRSDAGTPQCKFNGSHTSPARAAWMLYHDMPVDALSGLSVWQGCKNQGCIQPKHQMVGTRSEMLRWRGLQGLAKRSPAARVAITIARHARGVRFDRQELAAIRAAETTEEQEGKARGVSGGLIGRIRRHQAYRETVLASSIFSMVPSP